jgi:hypothetical protein
LPAQMTKLAVNFGFNHDLLHQASSLSDIFTLPDVLVVTRTSLVHGHRSTRFHSNRVYNVNLPAMFYGHCAFERFHYTIKVKQWMKSVHRINFVPSLAGALLGFQDEKSRPWTQHHPIKEGSSS